MEELRTHSSTEVTPDLYQGTVPLFSIVRVNSAHVHGSLNISTNPVFRTSEVLTAVLMKTKG
jgi:hypothetical protein